MFELQISGQTANYTVKQGRDGVVYCSCPAWRFQRVPARQRSCKHIRKAARILQGQLALSNR